MAAGQLVIVRHYEPPTPEEASELMRRVYDRLFDADLLERLTPEGAPSTIAPGENGKGAKNESGALHSSLD